MDPWSKVDYSRIIRKASMVEEKLPKVDPPFGRVPGIGLLTLPILEAQRRRNRGEIAKKGSLLGSFTSRRIYRRRGKLGGHQRSRRPPGVAPPLGVPGGRLGAWWWPSVPTLALLEASGTLIF